MSRVSGVSSVFVLAVVLMLSASPAAATFCSQCNCSNSCDQICYTGPDIPDCPGCNESTCGLDGPLCAGSPECTPGSCAAASCSSTINGTGAGDTLNGGTGHECINGLAGADTLSGNAGDDRIHGGDGNDTMYGGSGNDCLWGDLGGDNANGDSGSDFCDAESELTCEL
jgi:hypothetical protein